jgi:hypothetical protein
MEKFYKVIKENFLWEVGAILKPASNGRGYDAQDELYAKDEAASNEYVSTAVVEGQPEYFQRVYKVNLVTQTVYEVKERAKELLEAQFKS